LFVSSGDKELQLNTPNACVLAQLPVTLFDLLFGIFILGHTVYVTQIGVEFLAEAKLPSLCLTSQVLLRGRGRNPKQKLSPDIKKIIL
jgi:hypothetical protein